MAVFVSPKTDFKSDGDQLKVRTILKYEIKKPPKGYNNPLRGFTRSSSGNPTFSFYASEGKRFCGWVNLATRGNDDLKILLTIGVVKEKIEKMYPGHTPP